MNTDNSDNPQPQAQQEAEQGAEVLPHQQLKGEQYLIELRRSKVSELWAQGLSQQKIAVELHVSQQLISLDIRFLKQQARQQIKEFVTEKLPTTVSKAFTSLDLITTKAWETVARAEQEHDERTKLQALSLIKETEADKIEIVSNIGIVDQVISAAEDKKLRQRYAVPTPEEEEAIAADYIRDEKYSEEEEEEDNTDKPVSADIEQTKEDKPLFERKKAIPLHPEEEEK